MYPRSMNSRNMSREWWYHVAHDAAKPWLFHRKNLLSGRFMGVTLRKALASTDVKDRQHNAFSWQKNLSPVSCASFFCFWHAALFACYSSHSTEIALFGVGRAWNISRSLWTGSRFFRACLSSYWDKICLIDRHSQWCWRLLPWHIHGESLSRSAHQANWKHFVTTWSWNALIEAIFGKIDRGLLPMMVVVFRNDLEDTGIACSTKTSNSCSSCTLLTQRSLLTPRMCGLWDALTGSTMPDAAKKP